MRLTPALQRRLVRSVLVGYGIDILLFAMGMMNMYPEEWVELLPGTMLARKLFGGFLNPEGILAAFVFDGLVFAAVALAFWSVYERYVARKT